MMNPDEVAERIEHMLGAAIAGDGAEASAVLASLGTSLDGAGMYGVCCAVAEAGKRWLHTIYGDQAPQPGEGMWTLTEPQPGALADPAAVFGRRFLVAWANDDRDSAMALFSAAAQAAPEHYVDSVCALVIGVAELGRRVLEQNA